MVISCPTPSSTAIAFSAKVVRCGTPTYPCDRLKTTNAYENKNNFLLFCIICNNDFAILHQQVWAV